MIKKLIWVVLLLVIIVVSVYSYKEYNRKPEDLTGIEPAFSVTAKDIVNAFENDEAAAYKKYSGKIIEVTGLFASAGYQQDTLISIVLGEGMHKVGCELDKNHVVKIGQYQETNTITIKGICTGYLMDVEMNRCVIAK